MTTAVAATKLEKLNAFLQGESIDLPKNRRYVDKHGANLHWLRKHLSARNTVPADIQKLLDCEIGQLVKETC
ncbi:hypothetical protein BN7874_254 [Phage NCTB]|jgi:hypothetical protein|nr:hypothetical protein BN7874_254 [Phage NCTB]